MVGSVSKKRIGATSVLGVFVALGLLVTLASGGGPVFPLVATPTPLIKLHAPIELTSSAPRSMGLFGNSVAASGSYVAVGAPFESHAGHAGAGNVYLYNVSTGQPVANFGSPTPKAGGLFGYAVAMSGSTLVVGAPNETAKGKFLDAGNAYVYRINGSTATLQHTLPEPVPQAGPAGQLGGAFGFSVAVNGASVIVGAVNETSAGTASAGNVYIFSTGGIWIANLTTPNPTLQGYFGFSVAMSGTTAFVGAPLEGSGGHTYIVLRATGPANGRTMYVLASPNAQGHGDFGWAIAVSGALLVVGASSENSSGQLSAGNAYVFNTSTGLLTRQLQNPNPETSGEFGWSVAASGNDIVVAAPGNSPYGAPAAGNITVINATSGKVFVKLVSPNFQANGAFGYSVAADAACIVAGAAGEGAGSIAGAGHAYIY
jgi:hypothetical protein